MKILLGIILFHMLVIVRSKIGTKENTPYFSTLIISILLVAYVVTMLFGMEIPEP